MANPAAGQQGEATVQGLDHLSERDFQRLARFIQDYSGIKMPPTKKTMVEGRLRKRMAPVGVADLTSYCRYVFDRGGLDTEAIHLIDAVTTNKTEFFREPEHFRYLADIAVPTLLAERRGGSPAQLKLWSAASSIGAEPYTLAMVMSDLEARLRGFRTSILATDIAIKVLKIAADAIYSEEMVSPVPMEMRRRHLLRGKGNSAGLVRMNPELRRMVRFARLNLMENRYPIDQDIDIVFCRNILIYFDKPTQQAVLGRICAHLRPGGYLFLGHSESLTGFGLPLISTGTTIFRRK